MFELKAESHTGVTVLRYSGNLLLGEVAQFSKLLEDHLLAPGIRQVVLDLSRVEKVDTSGLGVLVSASTKGRGTSAASSAASPAPTSPPAKGAGRGGIYTGGKSGTCAHSCP